MSIVKNERGLSLVEVVIAGSLMVVIGLAVAKLNLNNMKAQREIETRSQALSLRNNIYSLMASQGSCYEAFKDHKVQPDVNDLNLVVDETSAPLSFQEKRYDGTYKDVETWTYGEKLPGTSYYYGKVFINHESIPAGQTNEFITTASVNFQFLTSKDGSGSQGDTKYYKVPVQLVLNWNATDSQYDIVNCNSSDEETVKTVCASLSGFTYFNGLCRTNEEICEEAVSLAQGIVDDQDWCMDKKATGDTYNPLYATLSDVINDNLSVEYSDACVETGVDLSKKIISRWLGGCNHTEEQCEKAGGEVINRLSDSANLITSGESNADFKHCKIPQRRQGGVCRYKDVGTTHRCPIKYTSSGEYVEDDSVSATVFDSRVCESNVEDMRNNLNFACNLEAGTIVCGNNANTLCPVGSYDVDSCYEVSYDDQGEVDSCSLVTSGSGNEWKFADGWSSYNRSISRSFYKYKSDPIYNTAHSEYVSVDKSVAYKFKSYISDGTGGTYLYRPSYTGSDIGSGENGIFKNYISYGSSISYASSGRPAVPNPMRRDNYSHHTYFTSGSYFNFQPSPSSWLNQITDRVARERRGTIYDFQPYEGTATLGIKRVQFYNELGILISDPTSGLYNSSGSFENTYWKQYRESGAAAPTAHESIYLECHPRYIGCY